MSFKTETKESLWEHLKVVEDERDQLLKFKKACKDALYTLEICRDESLAIYLLQQAINNTEGN